MTGPKISSWAMRMSLVTLAKSVGSTYQPRVLAGRATAADDDLRTLLLALHDVLLDPVPLALGHEGADLGVHVGRVADLDGLHAGGQAVDDLVVLGPAGQDAGLGHAGLPVVHEAGDLQQLVEGGVHVGVVEDDGRRLAAELQRVALELLAADGGDLHARRGRAGEGDLVDVGVADQVLADLTAGGQDVDHALGQAGLLQRLGQQVGVERGLGGGLQDHRGAGGEGRGQLEHRDEQRDVPRDDGPDDADGLTAHEDVGHHPLALLLEGELLREVGEVVDDHQGGADLAQVAEHDGRAHLGRDRLGEVARPGRRGRRSGW